MQRVQKRLLQPVLDQSVQDKVQSQHRQRRTEQPVPPARNRRPDKQPQKQQASSHDRQRGGGHKRQCVAGKITKGRLLLRVQIKTRGTKKREKGIAQRGKKAETVAVVFRAVPSGGKQASVKDRPYRKQRGKRKKQPRPRRQRQKPLFHAAAGKQHDCRPQNAVGHSRPRRQGPQQSRRGGFLPAGAEKAQHQQQSRQRIALRNEGEKQHAEGQRIDTTQQQRIPRLDTVLRFKNPVKNIDRAQRQADLPRRDQQIVLFHTKRSEQKPLQPRQQPAQYHEQGVLDNAQGGIHLRREKTIHIVYVIRRKQAVVVRIFNPVESRMREQRKKRQIKDTQPRKKGTAADKVPPAFHGVHSSAGTKTNTMSPGVS